MDQITIPVDAPDDRRAVGLARLTAEDRGLAVVQVVKVERIPNSTRPGGVFGIESGWNVTLKIGQGGTWG